jgi:uncharacterized protein YacL
MPTFFKKTEDQNDPVEPEANKPMKSILVDTSVIIDGRIADIARAGFVPGKLLVPRFVLAELQNIADSSDSMRRSRGRRGLEALNDIRNMGDVDMEVIEDDPTEIAEVDAKLVRLARSFGAQVLTTDYNLNRVAQIEGVRVLNINELANAIRPVVLPGEQMMVRVVQAGKEKHQGVGYLSDGTMIVVDQGDKLIGQEVLCEITRVFQTVAGKMLFAAPIKTPSSSAPVKPEKKQPNNLSKDRPKQAEQNPGKNRPNRPPKPQPRRRKSVTQQLEDSLIQHTNGHEG